MICFICVEPANLTVTNTLIINGDAGCTRTFLGALCLQVGQWLKSSGLVQRSAAIWLCSAFIAMTLSHGSGAINIVLALLLLLLLLHYSSTEPKYHTCRSTKYTVTSLLCYITIQRCQYEILARAAAVSAYGTKLVEALSPGYDYLPPPRWLSAATLAVVGARPIHAGGPRVVASVRTRHPGRHAPAHAAFHARPSVRPAAVLRMARSSTTGFDGKGTARRWKWRILAALAKCLIMLVI